MNKTPARLGKVEDHSPLMNFESWMLLHPAAIVLGLILVMFFSGALLFALSGGCAVESGVPRNFIAAGV